VLPVALEMHEQVDAVKQRPAHPAAMTRQFGFAAPAPISVARVAARTRVGRCHEHEPRRVDRPMLGPDDCYSPVLEWLAQGVERRPGKLRQLVQQQAWSTELTYEGSVERVAKRDNGSVKGRENDAERYRKIIRGAKGVRERAGESLRRARALRKRQGDREAQADAAQRRSRFRRQD
jgi:hypothetical protein